MSDDTGELRSTVFLDTNALIYIWSYLIKAKELHLPPYSEDVIDYAKISSIFNGTYPHSITGNYMKGCRCLSFLQKNCSRVEGEISIQLYTSRLSRVEMLNGALDGKAHILMAQQGVPYRMRQRITDLSDLISMRLRHEDVDEVVNSINEVFELIESHDNIIVDFVENDHLTDNIAKLAEFLSSRFYLDVIDIWMYACAITIQSDKILSFDGYFNSVINHIYANDEQWAEVRQEITEFVKKQWGWDQMIYPVSSKIPDEVPHLWDVS